MYLLVLSMSEIVGIMGLLYKCMTDCNNCQSVIAEADIVSSSFRLRTAMLVYKCVYSYDGLCYSVACAICW